ncbi:MAG TPA: Gfo/Idh/MocA family oxidoreductase [Tepidisphaeraceae bacterium]|nr:Gfo/Idh/MocA family oxidoreductase [Tepidisphaeraceae bacterium]
MSEIETNAQDNHQPAPQASRRQFMKASAAVGAALVTQSLASAIYAQGSSKLKIGLVGCGGRGSGAAVNALHADPGNELTAMCDLFPDKITKSLQAIQSQGDLDQQIKVTKDTMFSGWDGYKHLIDSVDVVLLATTPHFRPMMLKYAIEKGKQIFCEKPVGVDAKSVKEVMDLTNAAAQKNLNLVSGLCFRYDLYVKETMQQVHAGKIGDVVAINSNYNTTWLWNNARQPQWSDMEYQIRNWLYYYWLSGDHVVEQHIHSLDKALWTMNDVPPTRVLSTGGRQQRTAPQFGNIYDHFGNVFEWDLPGGRQVRCFSYCRQFDQCTNDVSDIIYGTEGVANLTAHKITGKTMWKRKPTTPENMYDTEHKELFSAIRSGKVINNGDYMCKSTLMGIMARESAYSGQTIAWDQILSSKQDLSPAGGFQWGPLPVAPVAVPNEYKFS